MAKKIIAVVCLLAILVGLFAMAVTQANAAEGSYYVGYNKVDINPYTTPGDPSSGLMALPLRGFGDAWSRLSVADKIDDNGDGKVDANDGLFATCIAISDAEDGGNTVLLISVDLGGSFKTLVDEARNEIVDRLGGAVSANQIMITASHTHGAPDIGSIDGSGYNNSDSTIQANNDLKNWKGQVVQHLAEAAAAAMEDRAPANLSKGEIDASTSAIKVMNSVRHYVTRVYTEQGYTTVVGSDNFNSDTVDKNYSESVSEVNDTLYLLQFAFDQADKKLPIVLANWRAHASMNSVTPYYNNITSDYINAFRYKLEYGGDYTQDYRVSFVQGASGNIGAKSRLGSESTWIPTTRKGVLAGNTYGPALATVARSCLSSSNMMEPVQYTGTIRTSQTTYQADRKAYTKMSEYAAIAARYLVGQKGKASYPFVYPDKVLEFARNDFTDSNWLGTASKAGIYDRALEYSESGEKFVVGSKLHASDLVFGPYKTDPIYLELNIILLGRDVAFVTAPTELFDRYPDIAWNDVRSNTAQGFKDAVTNAPNAWDDLKKEDTYGTPFVLGYCNGHESYAPNNLSYEYCQGSTTYATGSYETHTTSFAQGTGEAIVDWFDSTLETMTKDVFTDRCEACGQEVEWKPLYNRNFDDTYSQGITSGHYYVAEDITYSKQKSIPEGNKVCLDLHGCTLESDARAFYAYGELNIMDSENGGVVLGKRNGNLSGGVLFADKGTINLYGGKVQHAAGCQVINGGAVYVKGGTFRIFGGTVEGSKGTTYGKAVYVIKNGDTKGTFIASGGQVTVGETTDYGSCVYIANDSGKATLSGTAQVAQLCFPAEALTIEGNFTGSVQLNCNDNLEENQVVGTCTGTPELTGVTLKDSQLVVKAEGTNLVLRNPNDTPDVAVYDTDGELKKYNSLKEALDDYTYSEQSLNYIKLFADTDEAVTVSKDVYLDLNGCDITGQVTVNANANLYCMDSQTDNYDSTDVDCGKLTNVAKGSIVKAVPFGSVSAVGNEDGVRAGYMMLTNKDGVSFHRYYQDVSYYNLQTTGDGMYFTAGFYGDEAIKQAITENGRYGVALAIKDLADDAAWIDGIEDPKKSGRMVLYSAYGGTSFSSGAEVNSTVLKNIMSNANGSIINDRNAKIRVYGRPYIQIGNQYYFGDVVDDPDGRGETGDGYDFNTLQGLIMYMNDIMWDDLNDTQKTAAVEMYERYPVVLGDFWNADKIREEVKARKANG